MFIAWKVPRTVLVLLPLAALAAVAITSGGADPKSDIVPTPGPRAILSPMQEVSFRFPVPVADVIVDPRPPIPGNITTNGVIVTFRPTEPMRPGADYHFAVSGSRQEDGERLSHVFSYSVMPLADELWVYVKLDRLPHEVFIYRGDQQVRRMTASGGRLGFETPEGTFRIQNRGRHFFSQKYGEGGYYWVRIFGNYLFHSVPVDAEGRVIEEEAEKLGCPASHGCVRLGFEDAKWLYENVLDGALVVIDRT